MSDPTEPYNHRFPYLPRGLMADSHDVSPDSNVERVREKLLLRSQIGTKKYGVTTDRTDLDLIAWIRHLQEELMDAAVYAEKILGELHKTVDDHK